MSLLKLQDKECIDYKDNLNSKKISNDSISKRGKTYLFKILVGKKARQQEHQKNSTQ